jgi:phosphoribosyl-ATP pyrophosphohydrolase/phosphoribosyl-AMP cyclohydrolase
MTAPSAHRADAKHAEPRWGPDGLIPAIVQDAADGRVLMLAWMDAEALKATIDTGEAHFHSRSRDRLWRKGETSGHLLRLRQMDLDCDADTLLLRVDPVGPTCHRGTRSCFDADDAAIDARTAGAAAPPPGAAAPPSPAGPSQDFAWLETLWATIASRAADRPSGSYTTTVLDGGVDAASRKVTEEATEMLLAAKDDAAAAAAGSDRSGTREALAAETADLLYHALVLLAERDLAPSAVIEVLRSRHAG